MTEKHFVEHDGFLTSENRESMKFLTNQYVDYAKKTIVDRAIIGVDGLKPSQRRILFTMKQYKKNLFETTVKSNTLTGAVAEIHPHGDSSVYGALVRMVKDQKSFNIPFVVGTGAFGHVNSAQKPSASRYTEVKLLPVAEELFTDFDKVELVPTDDGKALEPDVLQTTFPFALVNASSGIAVGVASKFLPYNMKEVTDVIVDVIDKGDSDRIIYPDYSTGGVIVRDDAQALKYLKKGVGRFTLRGRYTVTKDIIDIHELPYYTTDLKVRNEIAELQEVNKATIATAFGREAGVIVTVKPKDAVPYVIENLIRNTDFEMKVTGKILYIHKNKPMFGGVVDFIKSWLESRREFKRKALMSDIVAYREQIERYRILNELLGDETKRLKFIKVLTEQGKKQATELLIEWFEGIKNDVISWIFGLSLSTIAKGGDKERQLSKLQSSLQSAEYFYENVDELIKDEVITVANKYSVPRRTEITDEVFNFDTNSRIEERQLIKATPVYVSVDGKFVTRQPSKLADKTKFGFECFSDDVVAFVDTQGRILKLHLDQMGGAGTTSQQVYLPRFLNIEDDFDIVACEVVKENKIVGYVYKDGYASVLDYGELINDKRATKIIQNGVSPLASTIISDIDLEKPYILLMTKEGKFCFQSSSFKFKNRTARTKLVNLPTNDELVFALSVSHDDMDKLVTNNTKYIGKFQLLDAGDVFDNEYLTSIIK